MGLAEFHQEQVTEAGQDQVARNGLETPNLEVIQTQFSFAVLKKTLDPPATEGHQQQGVDRGGVGRIAQEEFDFFGLEYLASEQQQVGSGGHPVFIF